MGSFIHIFVSGVKSKFIIVQNVQHDVELKKLGTYTYLINIIIKDLHLNIPVSVHLNLYPSLVVLPLE